MRCNISPWPLILAVLSIVFGCADDATSPRSQARIHTTVSLADAIVSPGDTVVATVRVANEGAASAFLVFYCGEHLGCSVSSGAGECVAGCIGWCIPNSIPLEMKPGDVLSQTFRYSTTDWYPVGPFAPGLYSVGGGLVDQSGKYPWAKTGLVVNEP